MSSFSSSYTAIVFAADAIFFNIVNSKWLLRLPERRGVLKDGKWSGGGKTI